MKSSEFIIWLKGFVEACNEYAPTPKQWDTIKDKLGEVKDETQIGTPIGDRGWGIPNTTPLPYYPNPYQSEKVRYGDICSCNPKNGGSGICGCIMGNEWVDKPKVGTISHPTNITFPNNTSITVTTGSSGVIYAYNPSTTAFGYPSGSSWSYTNTMVGGTLHSTPESEEYIRQQNDKEEKNKK